MIPKPLQQITRIDLQALIDTVREGKTVEFKRAMPAKTNEEVVKFLRAVSSLANTAGGDLLIGIEAKQGVAKAISGISGDALDDMKLRLSQILASQLEPRLPRVEFQSVECGGDRHVLIIRVQRSWLAPHRIKNDNTFYGRNSAGNYPLDVGELRTAFTLSDSVADRIRRFRADRLIKIVAGETPLPMRSTPAMVIHVVPFSTFAEGRSLDIVQSIASGHVMPLPPGRIGYPNDYRTNLEGLLMFPSATDEAAHGYSQVFRTGAVEGVDTLPLDETRGSPYLLGPIFENDIVATLRNWLLFLSDIDLPPPHFIFLSFCGMRGCHLRTGTVTGPGYKIVGPLQDDTIALPEVMIDADPADVPAAMRLTFNTIWNAFGFAKSDKYNAQGAWIGTG
jgi:Putative DNA-binding domain